MSESADPKENDLNQESTGQATTTGQAATQESEPAVSNQASSEHQPASDDPQHPGESPTDDPTASAQAVAEGGVSDDEPKQSGRGKKKKQSGKERMPYLIIASLTALTVFAANGAWKLFTDRSEPEATTTAEPKELIAEQIELVKTGKSDRIEISKAIITDEELASVRDLENLKILILDAGIISDVGMEPISTLGNLVHLRIRNSLITDVGIEHILGLESLRILNLPQANLTPAGMLSLQQLKGLRQLRIGGDGTTDLSRSVAELHNLRALHLIDIPVSDEGLRAIAKLPRLESLYLDNARVTEVGWQWLFNTHPEIHVHVNQRHHDTDPNWHLHNFEQDVDDRESQGVVTPESEEVLKAWEEQKKEAEKDEEDAA